MHQRYENTTFRSFHDLSFHYKQAKEENDHVLLKICNVILDVLNPIDLDGELRENVDADHYGDFTDLFTGKIFERLPDNTEKMSWYVTNLQNDEAEESDEEGKNVIYADGLSQQDMANYIMWVRYVDQIDAVHSHFKHNIFSIARYFLDAIRKELLSQFDAMTSTQCFEVSDIHMERVRSHVGGYLYTMSIHYNAKRHESIKKAKAMGQRWHEKIYKPGKKGAPKGLKDELTNDELVRQLLTFAA